MAKRTAATLVKIAKQNGHIGADLVIDGRWQDVADRAVRDPATGETAYPSKVDPDEGFRLLTTAYSGDFVFATAPHEDDTCPFATTNVVPMRTISTP